MGKIANREASGNQFTHAEWTNSNLDHFHSADASCHTSQRIRQEASLLIADRETKTLQGQQDVSTRLGDRVRDIREWKDDLQLELSKNEEETGHLEEARRQLEHAYMQTKRPLKVNTECLAQRENRVGIDQVKDGVEKNLKKEVENIRKYQQKMKTTLENVMMTLEEHREANESLNKDLNNKEQAYVIDRSCYVAHKNADEVCLHAGIEGVDATGSVPLSWMQFSNSNIKVSKGIREKSEELRGDIDSLINDSAKDLLHHWNNTNRAFQERISETQDTNRGLKTRLSLVDKEVIEMECLIQHLKDAKLGKQGPLKVAQTRLQKRSHRPDVEACNDPPHNRLVEEVSTLQDSVVLLEQKITESEAARLDLLANKTKLEQDIRVKENSLAIDQQKCMTMRMNFPYNLRCSVTSKRVERRRFKVDLNV